MIPRHFQITIALLLAGVFISGVYMIHLTQSERAKSQQVTEDLPVALPVGGHQQKISILVAYDEERTMRWRETSVFMPEDRSLRIREALRALLAEYRQIPSPHPMARNADIKEVYMINPETVVINTTAQFADGHPSGILLEEMTVASLIETLNANVPGVSRVKFIVDGRERETLAGHADLASFYDMAEVHALARELE